MRIDERVLGRHLEAAAVEQLRGELEAAGYDVRTEVPLDSGGHTVRMDLVARRGEERIYYEIKVLGEGRVPPEKRLSRLAQAARDDGGQFRLALVRPTRRTEVAVAGIEDPVNRALARHPPKNLHVLGGTASVSGARDVEIDALSLLPGGLTQVRGTAVATVAASLPQALTAEVPLEFDVTFTPSGDADDSRPVHLKVDLSEFEEAA
jgi:hypothetical protein